MEVVFRQVPADHSNECLTCSDPSTIGLIVRPDLVFTFKCEIFPNLTHGAKDVAIIYDLEVSQKPNSSDLEIFLSRLKKLVGEGSYQIMFMNLSDEVFEKLVSVDSHLDFSRSGFQIKITPARTSL